MLGSLEELEASGTIKGSMHIPKGVIEFRVNNNEDIDLETSIYVFCAIGVRSALAGHNLKKIGYQTYLILLVFKIF
jgi:rhodanese-related sulfurtransferase